MSPRNSSSHGVRLNDVWCMAALPVVEEALPILPLPPQARRRLFLPIAEDVAVEEYTTEGHALIQSCSFKREYSRKVEFGARPVRCAS